MTKKNKKQFSVIGHLLFLDMIGAVLTLIVGVIAIATILLFVFGVETGLLQWLLG